MSTKSALLYPTCYLRYKSAVAASLFLDEMLVMAPSEDSVELVSQDREINAMRITPIVASPLGDRLEDFKNGLKALETWGEQLGLGGNTGFETLYSALMNSGNEDIQGIIGAIKGGKKEDILMASRLFLRLSMDADQRMDQLDRELEQVEMDATKISELVEGLSTPKATEGTTFFIEPLNRVRERLRAWIRTFFSGVGVKQCWPVGESVSTKDLMDAAYESLSGGKSSMELARFSIPFQPERLCQEKVLAVRPLFARLLHILSDGAKSSEITEDKELEGIKQDIQQTIDIHCEASSQKGAAHMVVTIYPGHSWQEVALKAAGLTEKDVDNCPLPTIYGSLFLV